METPGSSQVESPANGRVTAASSSDAASSYNVRRLPEEVWQAEQHYLQRRREAAGIDQNADAVGLALSGGGIRSASFNLGFVQALMAKGKFREMDYLSTVSGGGYLGGFLGAQMAYLRQAADEAKAAANGPGTESPPAASLN